MINKPRYKTARRLGNNIFDKTQGQKYALREARNKSDKKLRPKSDFGLQMLEKQKAKVTYGVNERMFAKYVKGLLNKGGSNLPDKLMSILETRLDNAIYRLGLASTRQAARQMVSHGHIKVNSVRATIPSYNLKVGDKITIREASKNKPLFANLDEKLKAQKVPTWLNFDLVKKEAKVSGVPKLAPTEINFDLPAVLNFYSR